MKLLSAILGALLICSGLASAAPQLNCAIVSPLNPETGAAAVLYAEGLDTVTFACQVPPSVVHRYDVRVTVRDLNGVKRLSYQSQIAAPSFTLPVSLDPVPVGDYNLDLNLVRVNTASSRALDVARQLQERVMPILALEGQHPDRGDRLRADRDQARIAAAHNAARLQTKQLLDDYPKLYAPAVTQALGSAPAQPKNAHDVQAIAIQLQNAARQGL